jgi:hypothetical protein
LGHLLDWFNLTMRFDGIETRLPGTAGEDRRRRRCRFHLLLCDASGIVWPNFWVTLAPPNAHNLIRKGNFLFALRSVAWPGDFNNGVNIMENDLIHAYDKRMRKFNLVVMAAALVALLVLFSAWPFLQ